MTDQVDQDSCPIGLDNLVSFTGDYRFEPPLKSIASDHDGDLATSARNQEEVTAMSGYTTSLPHRQERNTKWYNQAN